MADDHLSTQDATVALQLLANATIEREKHLADFGNHPVYSDCDEETDSPCPIFDSFYHAGRSDGIHSMTNFSVKEFSGLWEVVRKEMHNCFVQGRGRKSRYKP